VSRNEGHDAVDSSAVWAFIRLGRPQFLVGGFLLYGIGAAAAVALLGVPFALPEWMLGQAAVTSLQLMTHYCNEYFDLAADQANITPTRWSGGSRVLLDGVLAPRLALRAAQLFAAIALGMIVVIAWRAWGDDGVGGPGALAAVALLAAGLVAWFYSAPPLVLHSRGLGEAATALVVTGLTPLAGFLLQGQGAPAGPGAANDLSRIAAALPGLGIALWPLLALQFVMLLAIEFPDAAGDAAVGKRTLVVRLGGARAAALYRAVLVGAYGALPLFLMFGALPQVVCAAGALSPVAAWQFWRLGRGAWSAPQRWEGLAFVGVALLVVTAAAELVALLWMISAAG